MKVQTENRTFQRDIHSKALLKSDTRELDEYKFKRRMLKKDSEINTIKEKLKEMDEIKSDLNEIKNLLKGLLNK